MVAKRFEHSSDEKGCRDASWICVVHFSSNHLHAQRVPSANLRRRPHSHMENLDVHSGLVISGQASPAPRSWLEWGPRARRFKHGVRQIVHGLKLMGGLYSGPFSDAIHHMGIDDLC